MAVTQEGTAATGHLKAEPPTCGGEKTALPALVAASHRTDATLRPNALDPNQNASNVVRVHTGPINVMQASTLSTFIRDTKIR